MDKLTGLTKTTRTALLALVTWPPLWYLLGGIVLDVAASSTKDPLQARGIALLGLTLALVFWPAPQLRRPDIVARVERLVDLPALERNLLTTAYRMDELLTLPDEELERVHGMLLTTPPEGSKTRKKPPTRSER